MSLPGSRRYANCWRTNRAGWLWARKRKRMLPGILGSPALNVRWRALGNDHEASSLLTLDVACQPFCWGGFILSATGKLARRLAVFFCPFIFFFLAFHTSSSLGGRRSGAGLDDLARFRFTPAYRCR